MSQKKNAEFWILFYAVALGIILLLAALFYPSASVLRGVGEKNGQGPAILIPLAFLLLSYLFAFLKARSLGKKSQWISSYGWLMGSGALSVVLLLLYLKQMTGK